MNQVKVFILVVLLFVLMAFESAVAHAFVIDGSLSDWGVRPGTWGASAWGVSDWTPIEGVSYTVEDQDPSVNYLNPGFGAQYFDAEAIYAANDSKNFYYAIVTGHPPTGHNGYYPGDVAFNIDGVYKYGIRTVPNGLIAGNLYSVSQWNYGIWNEPYPTKISSIVDLKGAGSLVYSGNEYGAVSQGAHYVIEGAIPVSAFGGDWVIGKPMAISWTETCGNDVIRMSFTPVPTPEPASVILLGIGLGMGLLRKRNKAA